MLGWISTVKSFFERTRVKFSRVNKIEVMYDRPRVKVKLSEGSTLRLRATFHTLSYFSYAY